MNDLSCLYEYLINGSTINILWKIFVLLFCFDSIGSFSTILFTYVAPN